MNADDADKIYRFVFFVIFVFVNFVLKELLTQRSLREDTKHTKKYQSERIYRRKLLLKTGCFFL